MAAERGEGQQQSQEMMEGERPLRATGKRRAGGWAGTVSGGIGTRTPVSGHSHRALTAAKWAGQGGGGSEPGSPDPGAAAARRTRAPGTTWREPAQGWGTDKEAAAIGT